MQAGPLGSARARDGGGPTAIEAMCVRFDGHFIGDPQLYRGTDEIKDARKSQDCLKIFRKRVVAEGWLTAATMNAIDKEIMVEIEKAVADALTAPHPDPATDLMSDVYCSY